MIKVDLDIIMYIGEHTKIGVWHSCFLSANNI